MSSTIFPLAKESSNTRSLLSEVGTVLLLGLGKRFLGVALESDELAHEVLIHVHDGRVVVEIATIVLCAEDGDELLILAEETIAVLHDLMPTAYQVEIVHLQEGLELLVAKDLTAASLVFSPVDDVLVRVVPKEVRHESAVGHIGRLGQVLDILERLHALGDATVHAHDLLVDKRDKGHVVEAIVECLPEGELVPSLDLIKEAINAGDGLTLVIAA